MQYDFRHPRLALLPPVTQGGAPGPLAAGVAALAAGDAWQAFALWSQSAERGDIEAAFLAGTLLAKGGAGLQQDLGRASRFLHDAVRGGHARAALNAALVELRRAVPGVDSEMQVSRVMAFLRLAAEMTDEPGIRDRVHRLTRALGQDLSSDALRSIRTIMDRLMTEPVGVPTHGS